MSLCCVKREKERGHLLGSVCRPASASCLSASPSTLEPPTTRRRRVRARNAASGCSLDFHMVAELRLTRRSEA